MLNIIHISFLKCGHDISLKDLHSLLNHLKNTIIFQNSDNENFKGIPLKEHEEVKPPLVTHFFQFSFYQGMIILRSTCFYVVVMVFEWNHCCSTRNLSPLPVAGQIKAHLEQSMSLDLQECAAV